jgi:hypothetical protein
LTEPNGKTEDPFQEEQYYKICPMVNGDPIGVLSEEFNGETKVLRVFNIGIVSSNIAKKKEDSVTDMSLHSTPTLSTLPKIEVLIM